MHFEQLGVGWTFLSVFGDFDAGEFAANLLSRCNGGWA